MYHSSITCYTDTTGLFTLAIVPGGVGVAMVRRGSDGVDASCPPGHGGTPVERRSIAGRALGCDHSPPGLYRVDFPGRTGPGNPPGKPQPHEGNSASYSQTNTGHRPCVASIA